MFQVKHSCTSEMLYTPNVNLLTHNFWLAFTISDRIRSPIGILQLGL